MLIIVTVERDKQLENVIRNLKQSVVRINIDENPLQSITHAYNGSSFTHMFKGVDLTNAYKAWYRVPEMTYRKSLENNPYELFNRRNRETAVKYMYGVLPRTKWISDPFAINRAENKMLQLVEARKLGMAIPPTLVTNDEREVKKFREKWGTIVVKPLAKELVELETINHAHYTVRITDRMEVDFSLLPSSPAIFQMEIGRVSDIRTTVIGSEVFSASIKQIEEKSGDVDWRVGVNSTNLEFKIHHLPEELDRKCVQLVRKLGLEFGAIDFILGIDGKYHFLEINPVGAWGFIENSTGMPMSEAMVRLLS